MTKRRSLSATDLTDTLTVADTLFNAASKLHETAAAGYGVSLTPEATTALANILFGQGRVALFVIEHADAQTIRQFATHPDVTVARSLLADAPTEAGRD